MEAAHFSTHVYAPCEVIASQADRGNVTLRIKPDAPREQPRLP